ncbi:MAG TPA: hypothetical protein VGF25_01000 [Thermoleophilaceae bacterium]|jgi:hypothetical protein
MRLLTRTCVLAALGAAVMIAPAAAPASGPVAVAAKRCQLSLNQQRHLGTTYVLNLSVSGTSCRSGRKVVKAYHGCRHSHGGADGHCSHVSGWRCGESRFNKSRFSYDAKATCTKGGRRVKHTYTQNI